MSSKRPRIGDHIATAALLGYVERANDRPWFLDRERRARTAPDALVLLLGLGIHLVWHAEFISGLCYGFAIALAIVRADYAPNSVTGRVVRFLRKAMGLSLDRSEFVS